MLQECSSSNTHNSRRSSTQNGLSNIQSSTDVSRADITDYDDAWYPASAADGSGTTPPAAIEPYERLSCVAGCDVIGPCVPAAASSGDKSSTSSSFYNTAAAAVCDTTSNLVASNSRIYAVINNSK